MSKTLMARYFLRLGRAVARFLNGIIKRIAFSLSLNKYRGFLPHKICSTNALRLDSITLSLISMGIPHCSDLRFFVIPSLSRNPPYSFIWGRSNHPTKFVKQLIRFFTMLHRHSFCGDPDFLPHKIRSTNVSLFWQRHVVTHFYGDPDVARTSACSVKIGDGGTLAKRKRRKLTSVYFLLRPRF